MVWIGVPHQLSAAGNSGSHALQRFLQSCSGDYTSDGILSVLLRGECRHDKEVLKVNEVPLTRIEAGLALPHQSCVRWCCAVQSPSHQLLLWQAAHFTFSFWYTTSCRVSQLISTGSGHCIRPVRNKSFLKKPIQVHWWAIKRIFII